jgi:phage I-like protein
MLLAKGDRRDFVVIDRAGGIHSLARRIDGMKAADLRVFMTPLDRESLPNIEQAQAIMEERLRQRRELKESGDNARLEKAYDRGDDYVSQSTAAQRDFEQRQEKLNQTARLNRLLAQAERELNAPDRTDHQQDAGPDQRPTAPGGGHARSR